MKKKAILGYILPIQISGKNAEIQCFKTNTLQKKISQKTVANMYTLGNVTLKGNCFLSKN